MTNRIEALVKSELLIWARENIGYSVNEAARKINVKPEKLEQWEKGISRPTIIQLRNLARVYKRPSAFFYLPKPPKAPEEIRDFRRVKDDIIPQKPPHLLLEIRRARYKRQIVIDLSEELNIEIPFFNKVATLSKKPENLANEIRSILNISTDEQLEWENRYRALDKWKAAIEGQGVLIFQTSHTCKIPMSEMRGFSISEEIYPTIVLNSKDSPSGKIFTLLHEFVHLMLNNGGICDLEEYRSPRSNEERTEVFCNRVAGEVLVPRYSLLENNIVGSKVGKLEWTDFELRNLAKRYSVSVEVILRRLLILGKTTDDFYQSKRRTFLESYDDLDKQRKEVGKYAPYHRLVIRSLGKFYINLVLNAYRQEIITSSDVSDYLGTKLGSLNKIEEEVMRG